MFVLSNVRVIKCLSYRVVIPSETEMRRNEDLFEAANVRVIGQPISKISCKPFDRLDKPIV